MKDRVTDNIGIPNFHHMVTQNAPYIIPITLKDTNFSAMHVTKNWAICKLI